jgi:hypothetical protein
MLKHQSDRWSFYGPVKLNKVSRHCQPNPQRRFHFTELYGAERDQVSATPPPLSSSGALVLGL